jgi:AsmA protein
MKPKTKKLILIAGGVAALMGAAVLAAPFFIPWDKVKDQAVTEASKALSRELSVGAVEVGFFTGVRVRDIRLANAAGPGFSRQPLFSVADAKLNVSLLSLFTGKVVINSITFVKPQILVETDPQGLSNLAGLGGEAKAPAKKAAPKAEKADAKPLPLVVAALVIEDGDIVIRDKQAKTETAVKGLDLKLLGLSLAAAGGSRLELDLVAEVEGKKIPLNLVSNFKLDLKGDSLDIRSLDATAPAVAVSAKALINGLSKAPSVDGGVMVELKLADLAKLLPPSQLKQLPGELKSGGTVRLNVQAKGGMADLKAMDLKAQLAFVGVDLAYGAYPGLSGLQGTLSVDKAGADLPALDFKLGGDPATLGLKARWGSLDNLLGGAAKLKADVELTLKAAKLNIDPVLAIALAEDTPADIARKAAEAKDLRVPDLRASVPAGLTFKSLIEVGALEARGLKTGALKQQVQLKGRVLQSSSDLGLYSGQFWERTRADFNTLGPVWTMQTGLTKLDFAPFIADAATLAPDNATLKELNGKLTGSLGFKADLKGKAFTRGLRFRNLSADGSFFMKDGVLKSLSVKQKLADVIPHPQTQALLRSDIAFANAVGEFSHGGGRTELKRFTLGTGDDWRGGDIMVQASGFMVSGAQVDFKVTPRFNPARVRLDGALGDAFNDKAGWPSYDHIAYYGPTSKEAKADFKAGLQKAAKQVVDKKVEAAKQQAQEAVQQKVQEKAGELLKQLPGGLFGR